MFNPNLAKIKTHNFNIGALHYDVNLQKLSSDTRSVYLRNKLNEVLYHMISNRHQFVSREELIQKVWAGNYCTGRKGVTHSVCKLRKTFVNLGEKQVSIKTIPKSGYALITN